MGVQGSGTTPALIGVLNFLKILLFKIYLFQIHTNFGTCASTTND